MQATLTIADDFVDANTDFKALISALKTGFASDEISVPQRHHHNFTNTGSEAESTLLLMPAWHSGQDAGVKVATVSPDNATLDLPSVHAVYILMNAKTGAVKAIFQAKQLTAKRTAAASALASLYLSNAHSSSLLMIGTGVLSTNLIRAHASVRPISQVYVWGRSFEKARAVCSALKGESFTCSAIPSIEERIGEVAIISCATLSKTPLVLGKLLREGQHVDLVGAYTPTMREADDAVIENASVFVDSFGGMNESGDIRIPLEKEIIKKEHIKGDLFSLCSKKTEGRVSSTEITVFKSVGHALEDLVAASYYYNTYTNG